MAPPAKRTGAGTPGRRSKKSNNQYFEVGVVGRKTGLTLQDTGIRDEHGLEPVSGIFSSPVVPQREVDRTLASSVADVQEGSVSDIDETIHRRKTPRLPPARQSTPRHTNIGSPKRMSSTRPTSRGVPERSDNQQSPLRPATQPRANRVLDFTSGTSRSRKTINVIENPSPFRPKKVLRRSDAVIPQNHSAGTPRVTDMRNTETSIKLTNGNIEDSNDEIEQSIEAIQAMDDEPIIMDDEGSYIGHIDQTEVGENEVESPEAFATPTKQDQRTPQISTGKATNRTGNRTGRRTPPTAVMISPSSKKRKWRNSELIQADDAPNGSTVEMSEGGSAQRKRGRPSNVSQVDVHRDEQSETIDPALLVQDDESGIVAQNDSPVEQPQPEKKKKGRPAASKGKARAPKERDPNRAIRASQSPSKRGGSAGPSSNVNLRATTPFEDAGQQTSRFGRNLIPPLKFWENEARIWKYGSIEGIVRAEPVERPKSNAGKRKKKGKKRLGITKLEDIEEESDNESIMPDEWEDTMGVLTGNVASWNPDTREGDPNDLIKEDLAFASSAIVTREIAGADFRFAKIMTNSFFGAGIVDLPADASKRAKNCGKMHMVFFVHDGKVMVEVGPSKMEFNQFALTKGGVWIVPRGNLYSITNESRTKPAKVFFAQGCMVNAETE